MTQAQVDALEAVRAAAPPDGAPQHMLPAAAYTSPEVLAWELRTLFAGQLDLPWSRRRPAVGSRWGR